MRPLGSFGSERWRRAALLAVLLVAAGSAAERLYAIAPRVPGFAAAPTYDRVQHWIDDAACAAARGVFLASCKSDGSLAPVEDTSLADDRGHGLLASLVARALGRGIDREALVWIHFGINLVGVFALTAALWAGAGARAAAVVLLLAGPSAAVPGPLPTSDVFASFFGAFCLGVTPLAWLAGSGWRTSRFTSFVPALAAAAFAAAWSGLLRQPIGLIGFVASAGVIALGLVWPREPIARGWAPPVRAAIVLVVLYGAVSGTTGALVALREILHGVPRGERTLVHGITHNLYIGLGTEPNSFGVEWGDMEGFEAVTAVAPDAGYVSDAHYDVLFDRWLSIVRSHPGEVASIYARKTAKTFDVVSGGDAFRGGKYLAAMAGLAFVLASFFRTSDPATVRLAIGLGLAAIGVAVQGILAAPSLGYLVPASFAFALAALALAEAASRSVLGWFHRGDLPRAVPGEAT